MRDPSGREVHYDPGEPPELEAPEPTPRPSVYLEAAPVDVDVPFRITLNCATPNTPFDELDRGVIAEWVGALVVELVAHGYTVDSWTAEATAPYGTLSAGA